MKEIWYELWAPFEYPRDAHIYGARTFILIADLCDERIECDECPLNPRPYKRYCDECPFD